MTEAGSTIGGSIGSLGTRAASLAVAAALGQMFVVGREIFVADQVGTSANLDALLVALIGPTIVVSLLSSSTQAALVPALIALRQDAGAARRLAGLVIAAVLGLGVLAIAVLFVSATVVIAITGPGLSDASRIAAQSFLPALLPLILFAPLGVLLASVCQVNGMFRAISISWIAGPVAAFAATILLWQQDGVEALAIATTVDAVATAALLVLLLAASGHLPRPGRGVARGSLASFARHATPLALGSSVLQLNLVTDRAVASILSTGAVSALRYGERVIRTPISILLPAWSTTVYPTIAHAVSGGEEGQLGRTAAEALRFVIALFLPLSLAAAALAPLLVSFVYERGAFGQSAVIETSGVVAGFAPLILLWLVQPILNSAHNARRRGGLLARNALINAASNLGLNIAFGLVFGVAGVALSTSVTGWLTTSILAIRLRELEPDFDLGGVLRVGARSLLAGLVAIGPMAILAWNLWTRLDGDLVQVGCLALATVVGAVIYLGVARLLRLEEPWIVLAALVTVGRRRLGWT